MTPAVTSPSDRSPTAPPSEAFAKDAIIAWFRGEFAAANAIIDALCGHVAELDGGGGGSYEAAFAAIHRRRLNWIPILQMQKHYSVKDCVHELRRVADEKKINKKTMMVREEEEENEKIVVDTEMMMMISGGGACDHANDDEAPKSEITDTGSQEPQSSTESTEFCSNHEECEARITEMKLTKGFIAKEQVKGRMVNVVRGLKVYEDVFTDFELSKLNDFVSELRLAGRNGELSGETYISYKQQALGIKRELIQFGVPIFGQTNVEATTEHENSQFIEPIPVLLQGVIDHLLQWHLISENRKPNSCIVNFFDEGEFSQPFLKPPHLDQPTSTLLLSESTMAFGRNLISDSDGNYRGSLMLSPKEGSLLVMRGNSSDVARHVMCASPNKRITITFFRVRLDANHKSSSEAPHLTKAMTLFQPNSYALTNGTLNGVEAMGMVPKSGLLLRTPIIMLAPMIMSPRVIPPDGTGVFLPWTAGSRKPTKRLPPRAQRRRLFSLPSQVNSPASDLGISVKG